MPPAARTDKILTGIVHACIAFFLFTAAQALAKQIGDKHDVMEIVFYRNAVSFVPLLAYILIRRKYDVFKPAMPGPLAVRVLIGAASLYLTYAACQMLPLANAVVIFFTGTLLVPVMAQIFLKEQVGWHRRIAALIGMSAVILIARPSAEASLLGIAVAFGAALSQASTQVLLRHMRGEKTLTVTFYFILGGVVIPGLFMPWIANPDFDLHSITILLLIGICGGLGQYFVTSGFQHAPASLLAPFNYTGLIWATGFDIWLFHYAPGWNVYAGAAIIISSGLYIWHRERLAEKRKTLQDA